MYRLEIGESPEPGLHRIMLEKIDEAIALLSFSAGPDVVHEVRKNIKRIRAALRLARPGMQPGVYRNQNFRFRDLGRLLAGARDAVVFGETLERILRLDDRPEEEIERYRRLLFCSDPGLPPTLPDPEPRLVERLISGLRSAASDPLLAVPRAPGLDFVYTGLETTARKARVGFEHARTHDDSPAAFHEWRKQVKYLWHQFELLASIADPSNAIGIEELEHLSEQLGLAHDAAILQDRLFSIRPDAEAEPVAGLVRRVERDRWDHEAAALLHGERIFRRKNRELLGWYPQPVSGDRAPIG